MNLIARSLLVRSRVAGHCSAINFTQMMYYASSKASAPASSGAVLTFLSPSPAYSQSAVEFLNNIFNLPRISVGTSSESTETNRRRDCLDEAHFGSTFSSSWHSIGCACPTSGTILHFLSTSRDDNSEDGSNNIDKQQSALQLISIHGSHSSSSGKEDYNDAMVECRKRLATTIQSKQSTLETRLRGMALHIMCNLLGKQPNPAWIFANNPSTTSHILPILDLTPFTIHNSTTSDENNDSVVNSDSSTGKLRELALPFFSGESSIQTQLSKSTLLRPLPGLYQCSVGRQMANEDTPKANSTGLIFRPLPAAAEDLRLSTPSLVFQVKSLAKAQTLIEEKLGGRTFKIGWRGHGQLGSLMVGHPSIQGLDIRLCETTDSTKWVPCNSFDEAQESLLAGSLSELQSAHVVSEGKSSSITEDKKIGNGDCWVEVRSNVKNPSGFLKQFGSRKKQTIAKPPEIPFE